MKIEKEMEKEIGNSYDAEECVHGDKHKTIVTARFTI